MRRSTVELHVRAARVWVDKGWVCLRLEDGREIRFPASKNARLQ